MKIAAIICAVLDKYADKGAGPRVRLSTFETAIVESGVHNLNYGDRDSVGVFQQRPWAKTGAPRSGHGPGARGRHYVRRATSVGLGQGAGQRRVSSPRTVQRSGYPDRYDQVQMQALALMEKCCGDETSAALALCALALSGCGVLDDAGPATQATPDPARLRPVGGHEQAEIRRSSELRACSETAEPGGRLRAGRRADRRRRPGRRGRRQAREPRHRLGSDGQRAALDVVGRSRAPRARGRCGCLTCQPTCAARSARRTLAARVELSGVKTCDGRRYFDHAEVFWSTRPTPSGQQPTTYVRAPC